MKRKTSFEIICCLFILLLVYTAVSKLLEIHSFRQVLSASPLLHNAAGIIAWGLPFVELMVAALLLFPSSQKTGLYATLMLMLVFTCYIGYMLVFTPHLPCSCGGVLLNMSWRTHLVFNIGCILLILIGIRLIYTERRTVKPTV